MAETKYIVTQLNTGDIADVKNINPKDSNLIGTFEVNSLYSQTTHNTELHFYTFDGTLLKSIQNFKNFSQLGDSGGAGKEGGSSLNLNPPKDALDNGYDNGGIRLLYRFTNNLYRTSLQQPKFFIESISPDRTEIRALSTQLTEQDIATNTGNVKNKLNSNSFFSEFFINFLDNRVALCTNIDTENTEKGLSVVFKLYEPLSDQFTINDTFTVEEEVSDEVLFEIKVETQQDIVKVPYIKGPNFSIEISEENVNPTEFFNFNELFSYPVTSSYYELRSLFSEKSAQIAIDHTDYSSFIHFSSAEERLRNFKYKLDLIDSYQSSISTIKSTGYVKNGITGSLNYYEGLVKGVVDNFDHYDRFLYYESGSNSWPKQNSTRPYINQASTTNESTTWFDNQLVVASNYDVTNFDILTNTVPTYIREDQNNEPYLMFIHMIAQHFDNLWIYFKAVSDKYDADNRLDFGVSKDLVRSAVESLGVKLYNSNQNLENLFSIFTGESYQSGSEVIDTIVTATSGSVNSFLQPVPKDNYLKEIYKRVYHNLPLLLKSKGTERGLRALINSFGIPSSILPVKIYGGIDQTQTKYTGQSYVTSSLDKVRVDNTGSYVTGSTLSRYVSIEKAQQKYSDDLHTVEIGFDISERLNQYFQKYLPTKFNIDDYIGDPRDGYETSYHSLDRLRDSITFTWENIVDLWENADWNWEDDIAFRTPGAFIRLIRFFDNSIFRVIKDFIPARSSINTGVVIKPDVLTRNKVKQVQGSWTRPEYTGSIDTAFVTGSNGGVFGIANKAPYTTNYSASFLTPIGLIQKDVTDEAPRFTGEFSGSLLVASEGELNTANTFKVSNQPLLVFDVTIFNLSLPLPPACDISLVSTYLGEHYIFYGESGQGTVQVTYPTTELATDTSITYVNNHNIYEYVTVEASPSYGSSFDGWYTGVNGSGDLITNSTILTLSYPYQRASGSMYYANFV